MEYGHWGFDTAEFSIATLSPMLPVGNLLNPGIEKMSESDGAMSGTRRNCLGCIEMVCPPEGAIILSALVEDGREGGGGDAAARYRLVQGQ